MTKFTGKFMRNISGSRSVNRGGRRGQDLILVDNSLLLALVFASPQRLINVNT